MTVTTMARNGRISVQTPENPNCTAPRHNPTDTTWRAGCRCPGAEQAHRDYLDVRIMRKRELKAIAAGSTPSSCAAVKHGTLDAWEIGCRCPAAMRKHRERINAVRKRATIARQQREAVERLAAKYRERNAVDSFVVECLANGVRMPAKTTELIAAVARMRGRKVVHGPTRWAPMPASEVGERLGISIDYVHRLRQTRNEWGSRRTRRRLVESQLRAFVVADAVGQKRQRTERHAVMQAAAERRRAERALAWKQHCRTMRRLRESRERAKVVALAMQRRRGFGQ